MGCPSCNSTDPTAQTMLPIGSPTVFCPDAWHRRHPAEHELDRIRTALAALLDAPTMVNPYTGDAEGVDVSEVEDIVWPVGRP